MRTKNKNLMKQKKVYNSVSEQELLDVVEIISKKLAYKFKFGYHEIEDMKQQIVLFALEGLSNYDNNRPLENFLWTHVRNRLFNYKRDNYQRPDNPCVTCPFFDKFAGSNDHNCKKFVNKTDCEIYNVWHVRNNSKKNLMYLKTIEDLKDFLPNKNTFLNNIQDKEIVQIIEEELTGEYRVIYLKMKYGSKIYKNEVNKLIQRINEILND